MVKGGRMAAQCRERSILKMGCETADRMSSDSALAGRSARRPLPNRRTRRGSSCGRRRQIPRRRRAARRCGHAAAARSAARVSDLAPHPQLGPGRSHRGVEAIDRGDLAYLVARMERERSCHASPEIPDGEIGRQHVVHDVAQHPHTRAGGQGQPRPKRAAVHDRERAVPDAWLGRSISCRDRAHRGRRSGDQGRGGCRSHAFHASELYVGAVGGGSPCRQPDLRRPIYHSSRDRAPGFGGSSAKHCVS